MSHPRGHRAADTQAPTPEIFGDEVKTLLCWLRDEGLTIPRAAHVLACAAEVAHAMLEGDENDVRHVARLDQIIARHVARLRSN